MPASSGTLSFSIRGAAAWVCGLSRSWKLSLNSGTSSPASTSSTHSAVLFYWKRSTAQAKQDLYDATGLTLGFTLTHLFQGLSEALPGEDQWGTAATTNLLGSWDLIDKGEPTLGQAVFHVQARWDYGTTGPEDLGFTSLGSAIGTADTFAEQTPTFVLRNLYWRQGSPQAGWAYRFGKITPDALLSSSAHLDSETTFLPSGGVSSLAVAFPDSGLVSGSLQSVLLSYSQCLRDSVVRNPD